MAECTSSLNLPLRRCYTRHIFNISRELAAVSICIDSVGKINLVLPRFLNFGGGGGGGRGPGVGKAGEMGQNFGKPAIQ